MYVDLLNSSRNSRRTRLPVASIHPWNSEGFRRSFAEQSDLSPANNSKLRKEMGKWCGTYARTVYLHT